MNCCNDYGHCTQGKDCPARELPITMDEPLVTFEGVMAWIVSFLAAVGLVACAGLVGLYFAGFFHWLAKTYPDSAILQFFFG